MIRSHRMENPHRKGCSVFITRLYFMEFNVDHDKFKHFLEERMSSQVKHKWIAKMKQYDF